MKRQIVLPLLLAPMLTIAADAPAANVAGQNLFNADTTVIYTLVALAVIQVVFIVSLAGIMRTMGGAGLWVKRFKGHGGRAASLLFLLFLAANSVQAQAFKGDSSSMSPYQTAWMLIGVNIFLFVLLLVQMNLLRGLTRAALGTDERIDEPVRRSGPTWVDQVMQRLTRQVKIEEEQDILMHHEYDGIRELDNVLPPWWLWLFYGTIIWGFIYVIAVHVIDIIPDQKTEFMNEVVQAQADVAAFNALQGELVTENTVTLTTEAGILGNGRTIFTQYCTPCHGADASGSETSVGPNLTDTYWLHGGGVKNVFHTITYGVPEKGMISWKSQLKPVEIRALACYILSLEGKGSATQKAPQGEPWTDEAMPPDSTAVGVDSKKVPIDTVRVAMQ